MFAHTLRASRSSIARVARQQITSKRTIMTPTAVRAADIVQDLYLKELKGYKPTPIKPSDAEGNVQVWAAPKPPKSPEEADIANELKSYESSTVELEGQAEAGETAAVEQDWFEEEPEDDEHAAH